MKKKGMGALAIWMVLLIVGLGATYKFDWKPLLGLDLQGGLSATLVPKPGTHPTDSAVAEAAEIIRNRVDGLGIAEPDVSQSGKTVVVQLPGLKTQADQDRAKKIIGTTAKLQFHKVLMALGPVPSSTTTTPPTTVKGTNGSATTLNKPSLTSVPNASSSIAPTTLPHTSSSPSSPPTSAPPSTTQKGKSVPRSAGVAAQPNTEPIAYRLPSATTVPSATAPPSSISSGGAATTIPVSPSTTVSSAQQQFETLLAQNPKAQVVSGEGQRYLVSAPLFDGTVLSSANAQLDSQSSQWEVNVTIKNSSKGKVNQAFNDCYAGTQSCPPLSGSTRGAIAMVLDGTVISAPTVNAIDLPKNPQGFVITGNFTHKSASVLALQLRYGALPVEFQSATLETVSATLGSSSLHAGLISGLFGLALVALYMLIFYRLLGLVAILSLVTSTGWLWVVISYLGAHNGLALTLAGITGIIVSIGVAVDSNVVFYEHLREDMTKGRSLRGTVHPSFKVAWRTIVSADVVSLIGAVVLYLLTIGSVRGFAFYLGLSTVIDLLASWFFMRPVVFWLASREVFNRRPGLLGVRAHHRGAATVGGKLSPEANG